MKFPVKKAKVMHYVINVCRIVLALTFIFSGFVKAVDPWGTGIKIGEYLAAFNMEWLYGWRYGISVWLNGAELMMGLMLLFKIRLKLISIFCAASMLGFTVLTFVLAIWNPVEDCGCFGDAIKLTNWETFIKNLILLPMSLIVLWSARKMPAMPTWRDFGFMCLFGGIAFGVGTYSYYHLPIIDFLPYKIGTDLPEAMRTDAHGDVETVVIYREKATGRLHEFDTRDTAWYAVAADEAGWEYVETETKAVNNRVHPSVRDFAIFDSQKFITDEVLADPGVVYMICASELSDIKKRCEQRLGSAVAEAVRRGYRVMCITACSLDPNPELTLGGERVECYNMDATTIKTILRAKVGIVVIRGGVIVDKENCRDIPPGEKMPQY